MYQISGSKISLPLHCKNLFISVFNAIIVLGYCNLKGTYTSYFEFYITELPQLYQCFLNWIKVFSEQHESLVNGIVLTKGPSEKYLWRKTVKDNTVYIVLFLETENNVTTEILFNYDNFNKYIQSMYFLTWQTLSLKDEEITILIKLMALPFSDLFEFKDIQKLSLFLKSLTRRRNYYCFVVQYHLETLFFLHKLNRIINIDHIYEKLNVFCTS